MQAVSDDATIAPPHELWRRTGPIGWVWWFDGCNWDSAGCIHTSAVVPPVIVSGVLDRAARLAYAQGIVLGKDHGCSWGPCLFDRHIECPMLVDLWSEHEWRSERNGDVFVTSAGERYGLPRRGGGGGI